MYTKKDFDNLEGQIAKAINSLREAVHDNLIELGKQGVHEVILRDWMEESISIQNVEEGDAYQYILDKIRVDKDGNVAVHIRKLDRVNYDKWQPRPQDLFDTDAELYIYSCIDWNNK